MSWLLLLIILLTSVPYTLCQTGSGSNTKGSAVSSPQSTGSAPAKIVVTMSNHALGESVEQYREVEHISGKCSELLHDDKLAAKILKWQQSEKKHPGQFMHNPDPTPSPYPLCQQLQQAESGSTETYSSPMFEITFVEGRLVRFQERFNADATESFNEILADLTKKYGAPDIKATEAYQNTFGAVFPVGRAHWTLADKTTISAVESVEYISSLGDERHTLVTIAQPNAPRTGEQHKSPF